MAELSLFLSFLLSLSFTRPAQKFPKHPQALATTYYFLLSRDPRLIQVTLIKCNIISHHATRHQVLMFVRYQLVDSLSFPHGFLISLESILHATALFFPFLWGLIYLISASFIFTS